MGAAGAAEPGAGEDEVRMIRDSAGAVAPRSGDLRRIRALRFGDAGFDRAVWGEICGLGWPGLRLPEEAGGAGLGMLAFCALAEELGAGLVPEPLIPAALAARLLAAAPEGAAALSALLSGGRIILPAWQDEANTLEPGTATRLHDGRLTGRKRFIPMAAGADAFLVVTNEGAGLVARDGPGVTLTVERTQDGGNFGTLSLDGAQAESVPAAVSAPALEEATLATAAYLLGVMERAFAMTLDYLRTRRQFGKPIGSFQALQHRAADLKLQLALTRASVEGAAAILDRAGDPTTPACRTAVSRAKARASEAAMLVTRQAIQLHGGIGYTDEYDAGLCLRKAMVLANLHGSAALHRARFAALTPEEEE